MTQSQRAKTPPAQDLLSPPRGKRASPAWRRWLRRVLMGTIALVAIVAALGCYGWFIDPGLLIRSLRSVAYLRLGVDARVQSVQGHDWPYLEAGPRDGPPMLFLHGFGTSKDAMMQMASAFGRKGWHCIAPDLPGFGDHAFHDDAAQDAPFYVAQLGRFMDAVGMPRATLVGTSMGGALAAETAIEDPARVQALLLLSPAGVRAPVTNAFMRRVDAGENPLDIASSADFDQVMQTVFLRPPSVPSPYRRWFVSEALRRRPETLQIVESLRAFLTAGLEGRLGAITAPTLVLYGAQDAVTDPSMLEVFQAQMPAARGVIVPDAGHVAFADNWPQTRRAMEEFLDSLATQRSTNGG